jgi:hypothetical protein
MKYYVSCIISFSTNFCNSETCGTRTLVMVPRFTENKVHCRWHVTRGEPSSVPGDSATWIYCIFKLGWWGTSVSFLENSLHRHEELWQIWFMAIASRITVERWTLWAVKLWLEQFNHSNEAGRYTARSKFLSSPRECSRRHCQLLGVFWRVRIYCHGCGTSFYMETCRREPYPFLRKSASSRYGMAHLPHYLVRMPVHHNRCSMSWKSSTGYIVSDMVYQWQCYQWGLRKIHSTHASQGMTVIVITFNSRPTISFDSAQTSVWIQLRSEFKFALVCAWILSWSAND